MKFALLLLDGAEIALLGIAHNPAGLRLLARQFRHLPGEKRIATQWTGTRIPGSRDNVTKSNVVHAVDDVAGVVPRGATISAAQIARALNARGWKVPK